VWLTAFGSGPPRIIIPIIEPMLGLPPPPPIMPAMKPDEVWALIQ
jgi:hypothetical protein